MQYQSTVFSQLLKEIPRAGFERLARAHACGRRKRTLSAWGHLLTMVFAQLGGARGLREVELTLERQPGALPHLGLKRVRRSTLSDANATRPAALFEAVAAMLSGRLAASGPRREALRLIDATRIFAGRRIAQWAGGGVKLHVMLDAEQDRPVFFAVTPERINDIVAARTMPIEARATYVFDKGYYDFGFWARLHASGARFVTRLKKNSPTETLEEREPCGEDVLFDRLGRLSQRLAARRSNPLAAPVRLVGVRLDGGRVITLVSNDLEASATEIARLYKARWQVELFFKWIKQNLKIAHFLGASRNAVIIQIMAALIAYLLLRLALLRHRATITLQAFVRLMPHFVLTRRDLPELFSPPDPPDPGPALQIEIAYA
jgi:Transposase DDE domain/Domain of unknown function (DUF4372)